MQKYHRHASTRQRPQSQPIPGKNMKKNAAGGYAFKMDDWGRLDRFLILGAEGGTYYASEAKLTRDNAAAVMRCIEDDGPAVVRRIVEISRSGRAPKQDPAIFALALCAGAGLDKIGPGSKSDPGRPCRKAAADALPLVCRTGTALFHFAEYAQAFRGWGRLLRAAAARWYNDKPAERLAYQLAKYQGRDGWTNRDVLRLAHAKPQDPAHALAYGWAAGKLSDPPDNLPAIHAMLQARELKTAREMAAHIALHRLPRECVPTEWLDHPAVWEALLEDMPLTAMIRNLATMTRVKLLAPYASATKLVIERLNDAELLHHSRVHPIGILMALRTYAAGRGIRGHHTWEPLALIADALNDAFYKAFTNVPPTGKRLLIAVDVSGSMDSGEVAGCIGLTPRIAAAAQALVFARSEPNCYIHAFSGVFEELPITPGERLNDVICTTETMSRRMTRTDCSVPIVYARDQGWDVDAFVIITDSETWAGEIHPVQALAGYRRKRVAAAKLAVVAMTSGGFSIADPEDGGMLDVVGFDAAVPQLVRDFIADQPEPQIPDDDVA